MISGEPAAGGARMLPAVHPIPWRFQWRLSSGSFSILETRSVPEGSRSLRGEDGYRALQVVESIYESCRKGSLVRPLAFYHSE